jgi:hypothetical protein
MQVGAVAHSTNSSDFLGGGLMGKWDSVSSTAAGLSIQRVKRFHIILAHKL